jgi:hypothetical protein
MMSRGCKSATIGPDYKAFIMVESAREIDDKVERETRFYVTSFAWLAAQLWAGRSCTLGHREQPPLGQGHDDECRACADHAPHRRV